LIPVHFAAQQPTAKTPATSAAVGARTFTTAEQAADALVDAAEKFDERVLKEIFGPSGDDIFLSGEYPQDRKRASDFAGRSAPKEKHFHRSKERASGILLVGTRTGPFPYRS